MKNSVKKTLLALAALFSAVAWADSDSAPQINESLNPESIKANEFSTLAISINNPSTTPLRQTAPFIKNLPAGVVILGSATTTCSGKLTATINSAKIILTGAKIAAGENCQILVGISSTQAGAFEIKTQAGTFQTNNGSNSDGSGATLTVEKPVLVGLQVKKSLNPPTIKPNAFNTLTITLINPNSSAVHISTPFKDRLPSGMVISGSSRTTCGGSLVAKPGTTEVTLQQAKIGAFGTCDILLGVKAGATAPVGDLKSDTSPDGTAKNESNISSVVVE